MPQPGRSAPRPRWPRGAFVLAAGLAATAAPGPAARAGNTVQWRLEANVPVICAILQVETPAAQPTRLAVATTCNAERYQLLFHPDALAAGLRAARSSAGPVQISGNAVTITSSRPGYALTTIDLAAPVTPGQLAVTLQPM